MEELKQPNWVKVVDGETRVDLDVLLDEITDLKEQLEEKDYQILKITQRLDRLEGR